MTAPESWEQRLLGEQRFRQSLLSSFETCPRRTYHALRNPDDLTTGWVGSSADLGSAGHAVFAEILRTLYRQGEVRMSTQEAIEIAYEVLAAGEWVLPSADRETLRILTLRFVEYEWNPSRILGLEMPLEMDIVCQDGVTRTFTGRPDLLLADPPDGVVIADFKTGWGVPRTPRKRPPEGEPIVGKDYLSDRGHFQLIAYGALALHRYPAAKRATLRELHLRSGEIREAELLREELEHVERELGVQMMLLERGIAEGKKSKLWKPRPGHHCLHACPVARSCPVPQSHRGVGAVGNRADADRQAARAATTKAVYTQLRERLKAYHEATGYAPQVGDGQVWRWKDKPDGKGRSFDMHEPEDPEERERLAERERETVDAMERELARRQAMAGVT